MILFRVIFIGSFKFHLANQNENRRSLENLSPITLSRFRVCFYV